MLNDRRPLSERLETERQREIHEARVAERERLLPLGLPREFTPDDAWASIQSARYEVERLTREIAKAEFSRRFFDIRRYAEKVELMTAEIRRSADVLAADYEARKGAAT